MHGEGGGSGRGGCIVREGSGRGGCMVRESASLIWYSKVTITLNLQ